MNETQQAEAVVEGLANRSWAPEVTTSGNGGWSGNALRFPTREEAWANVNDLASRWFAVQEVRVVPSDDPPNYRWEAGRLVEIHTNG